MNRFPGHAAARRPAGDEVSVRISHTQDADEQAACLAGWGQCYEQMSSGRFNGHFESYGCDGIELFREETNQVVQEYGQPQPDTITVASLQASGEAGRFCGAPVENDHYLYLRGGQEFHFRTPQRVTLSAVTVDLARFGAYCERVGEWPPPGTCMHNGLVRKDAQPDLAGLLSSLLQSVRHSPDMLRHAALRRCLEEALHSTLLGLCPNTETSTRELTTRTHQYVVDKARTYMHEHVDEPITVSDLCAHIRVSRRTLQYSFQNVLGTNPARYLRNMRLNGARREIRRQVDERTPLADVAARWGFWHPSRFAAEYRSLFGELPSQTLKAAVRH